MECKIDKLDLKILSIISKDAYLSNLLIKISVKNAKTDAKVKTSEATKTSSFAA